MSNVSLGSHGPVWFSIHLSGIVNGLTQVIAFAGEASAVAVAAISAVDIPKYFAIRVDSGLPREALRKTVTFTRFETPPVPIRNSTSAGVSETTAPITWLACPVVIALVFAGPVDDRSSKLSK